MSYSRVNSFWSTYLDISIEEKRIFDNSFSEKIEPTIEDDPGRYIELSNIRKNSGIKTIVFTAMAIEALVNDYGLICLGDSFYQKHIDKLDSSSKIIIVLKIAAGKDFPKEKQVYEHMEFLFKIRNKLVHSKSKAMPFKNGRIDGEALDKMLPIYFTEWRNTVNKCYETINLLGKTLHELEPDELLFLAFKNMIG